MVDVAGVVEGVDESAGDEFMVEDDWRRPKPYCVFVGEPSLVLSCEDCRELFLRRECRNEGMTAMLLKHWGVGDYWELIRETSGSQRTGAEKLFGSTSRRDA